MERKISLIGSFATDWIKYSDYEYREDAKGNLYICPKEDASFSMYNPFNIAENLIIDFLEVGNAANDYDQNTNEKAFEHAKNQAMLFVKKYGLLGFISASVLNQNVIGDNEVLMIEKNHMNIKDKSMDTQAYLELFTPFAETEDIQVKYYKNSIDLVKAEDSPKFYGKRPIVIDLIFSRFYCERLDWILQFAGMLAKHFDQLLVYRNSTEHLTQDVTILADAFKANKIGFTINQLDKTFISWEFDSLKTTIETIYAFAVTDETILLSKCKHCGAFYIALSNREKYCSPVCRNRSNVQKSRRRKNEMSYGTEIKNEVKE